MRLVRASPAAKIPASYWTAYFATAPCRFDRHQQRRYFTLKKAAELREDLARLESDVRGEVAYRAFSAADFQAPLVRQPKWSNSMNLPTAKSANANGCVTVPGCDVPILPGSGMIPAAICWTIASERGKLGP